MRLRFSKCIVAILIMVIIGGMFNYAVVYAETDEYAIAQRPDFYEPPMSVQNDSIMTLSGTEDYRSWAQADSRWGSIKLGSSSYTVANSGCLVTSVTKLIIQAGLKDSGSFNVGTFVNAMNSKGGFTSSGDMYWATPTSIVSGLSYYGALLSYGSYSSSNYNSQIISWINSGYHIVLNVNSGGHWIAIDEAKTLATGQVYIMDSLSGSSNADIALTSRYSTFNNAVAYKGGNVPNNGNSQHSPIGAYDIATGGENSVFVRGWAYDPDDISRSVSVHVYIDGKHVGTLVADGYRADVNNIYGCGEYHGFVGDVSYNVTSSGEHTVEVYALELTYGSGGVYLGSKTVTITPDATPPVISNVVIEPDSEGYTITCDVEDESAIDRAMFPTWTSYNGQDDLEGADGSWPALECHRGTVSNGKATFRVNRSDHNNEYGVYRTDIYIYDIYENGTLEKITYTLEEHVHEYTDEITKEATCTKDGVRTYTCSCGDSYTETIEATGHNYSNGSCTKCGAADPDYEIDVDVNSPQIIVESKTASSGDSVDVTIALKNNPGVASMKLKVAFDSLLTLENISYNSSIGGQSQQPQSMTSPVTLNWYNGSADSEGDWTFATLTFKVSEDVAADTTANVIVTYNADDVYDISETNIDFAVQNGEIIIADYLPGDINGDGYVNNKDLTRLFQYLSDWDVEVVQAALDVNGDGSINNKDQTRLFQYLSDWDVAIY